MSYRRKFSLVNVGLSNSDSDKAAWLAMACVECGSTRKVFRKAFSNSASIRAFKPSPGNSRTQAGDPTLLAPLVEDIHAAHQGMVLQNLGSGRRCHDVNLPLAGVFRGSTHQRRGEDQITQVGRVDKQDAHRLIFHAEAPVGAAHLTRGASGLMLRCPGRAQSRPETEPRSSTNASGLPVSVLLGTEKELPHNLDAERSVLGAVLVDNSTMHVALQRLKPGDFHHLAHRRIFAAMIDLAERTAAIDLVTLKEMLERSGGLEASGGTIALAALLDGVPRSANVDHYAAIVKDKAVLREMIDASNRVIESCFAAHIDCRCCSTEASNGGAHQEDATGFGCGRYFD